MIEEIEAILKKNGMRDSKVNFAANEIAEYLEKKAAETHYLLSVWADVEPTLEGPFASDETRLTRAREIRTKNLNEEGGLFKVDMDSPFKPAIETFAGVDLDENSDDVQEDVVQDKK